MHDYSRDLYMISHVNSASSVKGSVYDQPRTDHVADHALITWLSCTNHVADHALITWLIYTDHVADNALITWLIIH